MPPLNPPEDDIIQRQIAREAKLDTMKAWQYVSPGGTIASHIQLTSSAPKPLAYSLKGGSILVKVAAASINPADYKVPQMGFVSRVALSYPKTLAMDGAGIVEAAGPDAHDVNVGDHVTFHVDPRDSAAGSLSEYIIVKREGYAVVSKATDLVQAASLGTAALTAYQTIKPHVKPGDSIFINGGAGGVGTFGIQMAKILGCYVAVTCSAPKAKLCEALGADEVIDYRTQDVVETLKSSGRKYALVVDFIANSPANLWASASEFLGDGGLYILGSVDANYSGLSNAGKALFWPGFLGGSKHRVQTYLTYYAKDDMVQIAQWLDEGKLRGVIDKEYDFKDVVEAFEHLKTGRATGKIVIRVP